MKRKLYAALIPLSLLFVGVGAHAETPKEKPKASCEHKASCEKRHEARMERMKERLNLTDDQSKKVQAIFSEAKTKHECKSAATAAAKQKCVQAKRADVNQKLAGVLDKDQMAKFETMQKERQERRAHYRESHRK